MQCIARLLTNKRQHAREMNALKKEIETVVLHRNVLRENIEKVSQLVKALIRVTAVSHDRADKNIATFYTKLIQEFPSSGRSSSAKIIIASRASSLVLSQLDEETKRAQRSLEQIASRLL